MEKILAVNAHLKYVEYLLHVFDTYPEVTTLGEVRKEFENRFSTRNALLNQNFGIYRLLPLILMKEVYKNDKKELAGVIEQIKIIRDSIAHNNFTCDEHGYHFKNNKLSLSMTYDEFTRFLHTVENAFYEEKHDTQLPYGKKL